MRIAALIVATILLLGTAGMGLLGARRSLQDASDIDSIYAPVATEVAAKAAAGNKMAQELQTLGAKTGRLRAGGGAFALVGLLSLALLVIMYTKKSILPHIAGALVLAAVAAVLLSPAYDLGPLAPASAKSLAYVVAALAALGAGASYGARAARLKMIATT